MSVIEMPSAEVRRPRGTAEDFEQLWTVEEFLRRPSDGPRCELLDGRMVLKRPIDVDALAEKLKTMTYATGSIEAKIVSRIDRFLEARPIGRVFSASLGFRCFPHRPSGVRYPDGSYIRNERLPNVWPNGPATLAPDLIFEVASPNDLYEEVASRLIDFRRAGVPLMWVFSPANRSVRVLRADGSGRELLEGDTLLGEEVLPGFAVPVAELLPPLTAMAPAPADSTASATASAD